MPAVQVASVFLLVVVESAAVSMHSVAVVADALVVVLQLVGFVARVLHVLLVFVAKVQSVLVSFFATHRVWLGPLRSFSVAAWLFPAV